MSNNDILLSLKNLKKHFPIHGGILYRQIATVHAVDGISFDVREGETVGIVGESGCGKSTIGKTLLHLYKPTEGEVLIKKPADVLPLPVDKECVAVLVEKMNTKFETNAVKSSAAISAYEAISKFKTFSSPMYLVVDENLSKVELLSKLNGINLDKPFTTLSTAEKSLLIQAKDSLLQNRMMVNIEHLSSKELRVLRKEMQMIFQDPMEALNARMTVGTILEEPFVIHKGEHEFDTADKRKEEILRILKEVGLPESSYHKYPHEFSGGQRQRIGIARAIALKPKLVVCDEPVSALDVSVQSQVLNLMVKLQKDLGLTYIFIAHNLSVVKYIADRICVMYLGRVVETAKSAAMYEKPMHPYTQALISAIPEPDPTMNKEKQILEGDVPSPINPPPGCHFHPRCPFAQPKCKEEDPTLRSVDDDHSVACHFAGELKPRSI